MAINPNEQKELNFEEAMARLEQIVRALEGGNVPLDESLTLYEEGVKLVKLCSSRLDNAEKRIKILRTAATERLLSRISRKAVAADESVGNSDVLHRKISGRTLERTPDPHRSHAR